MITVNGSDDGFDGFRIGLAGLDNPMRDAKTEEVKRNIGQVSDPINLVPRILPQPRFHRLPICPKLWRPFLYPAILAPKLLEWNVSMNKNGDYRNRTRHLSIMS